MAPNVEPQADVARRAKSVYLLMAIIGVLLIIGMAGIVVASALPHDEISHHIIRDFAVASLISAIVTVAYEIYIRKRIDLGKMSEILETVYGSGVPPAVWTTVVAKILRRDTLRQDVILRLRILRDDAALQGRIILELDYEYKLVNLRDQPLDVPVGHALDDHIAVPAANLPCFVSLEIGERVEKINARTGWRSRDGRIALENGRLDFIQSLPRGASPVTIRVRRREVRECPGSYYLLMDELVNGIRVQVDECDPNVRALLTIRPDKENIDFAQQPVVLDGEPLLPGHGVELKFIRASGGA